MSGEVFPALFYLWQTVQAAQGPRKSHKHLLQFVERYGVGLPKRPINSYFPLFHSKYSTCPMSKSIARFDDLPFYVAENRETLSSSEECKSVHPSANSISSYDIIDLTGDGKLECHEEFGSSFRRPSLRRETSADYQLAVAEQKRYLAEGDEQPLCLEQQSSRPEVVERRRVRDRARRMQRWTRATAKNWFLTYPRNSTTKEDALLNIRNKWSDEDIDHVVLGREVHKLNEADPEPHHLHILLSMNIKLNATSCNYFDFIAPCRHGNYQTLKRYDSCLAYVTKDNDYIGFQCNVEEKLQVKKKKFAAVESMLNEGCSLIDVIPRVPGFVLQNFRKLREYVAWREEYVENHAVRPPPNYSRLD